MIKNFSKAKKAGFLSGISLGFMLSALFFILQEDETTGFIIGFMIGFSLAFSSENTKQKENEQLKILLQQEKEEERNRKRIALKREEQQKKQREEQQKEKEAKIQKKREKEEEEKQIQKYKQDNFKKLLGIQEDMSNKEVKVILKKAFRIWNQRIGHSNSKIREEAETMLYHLAKLRKYYA